MPLFSAFALRMFARVTKKKQEEEGREAELDELRLHAPPLFQFGCFRLLKSHISQLD